MQCSFPECPNEASVSYSWPWGEDGCACDLHRVVLTQRSIRLKRQVAITVLQPGAPRPIGRDERIAYEARILAMGAELDEVRGRSLTIQQAHAELARQAKTDKAALRVLEDGNRMAKETIEDLREKLSASERERVALRAELDRRDAHDAALDPIPFGAQTVDGRT